MSTKRPRRGGDFTISAPVTGAVIANNSIMKNVTASSTGETGSASLDDLRQAVASLRAEVEAVDGSASGHPEVQSELGRFEEELGKDEPDRELVGIRWTLVQKLLGPLQQVGNIAAIADRILTLTRSLFGGN